MNALVIVLWGVWAREVGRRVISPSPCLSRVRSPPVVTVHRPSLPQWGSHHGKFQEEALASTGIQNLISPPIRWKIRELLTPRPLSPSSPSPDSGLQESLRDLWFHLYKEGKLPPCIGSGRSSILPNSHLDNDTSFLNLVHLDTMASLLAKRILLLHPTHWWGSYLESTDWWNYNPTWLSTIHQVDFANWPAVPPRMDTIAPRDPHLTAKKHLFHSSSPLHSGYHSICLTLFFNKRIQT